MNICRWQTFVLVGLVHILLFEDLFIIGKASTGIGR